MKIINWKTLISGFLLALGAGLKTHAPNTIWWHVGEILTYLAPMSLGAFAQDAKKA